jgi:hypothetical protein
MTRLLLIAAVGVAALTGCGGGDDDSSDGGNGPSRKAFVEDVNATCRDGEEKIAQVTAERQQELQGATSDQARRNAVSDVLEETAEAYRPYLDRLRDLEAPADIAEDWSSFLDGITEAFDLIPELAQATRENDEEQLSKLSSKFTEIAQDTRPFAERTGLDDCLPDEGTQ